MEDAARDISPEATVADQNTKEVTSSPRPRIAILFAAAILAGVLGWLGGEAVYGYVEPVTRQVAAMGGSGVAAADGPAVSRAETRNAVNTYALSGAALGLCLGLAGAWNRPGAKSKGAAAIAGLVLGGAVGAGVARLLVSLYWEVHYGPRTGLLNSDNLFFPLLINSGVCAALGATGAAAFALGDGRKGTSFAKLVLSGLFGGVVAAIVFEVCAALIFSHIRAIHPIPPIWAGRLLDRLLVPLFVAAFLAATVLPGDPRKTAVS